MHHFQLLHDPRSTQITPFPQPTACISMTDPHQQQSRHSVPACIKQKAGDIFSTEIMHEVLCAITQSRCQAMRVKIPPLHIRPTALSTKANTPTNMHAQHDETSSKQSCKPPSKTTHFDRRVSVCRPCQPSA
jgi:hypothetical protein